MNVHQAIEALKHHAKEEWRIHAEFMKEASKDTKQLAKKHWQDTKKIHQEFFNDLKKAAKNK